MDVGDSLPLCYASVLGPLRMRAAAVIKGGHQYSLECDPTPSREKMSRLAQEMVDAASSLPCTVANAIFMRVDHSRADVLRVLVTGVDGTPYAGGCFEFDVMCPAGYPDQPPKVHLCTGNQRIRFNPNLYNNGKVCLSLLGTWAGKGGEAWTSSSTLLQVFLSVQSLIMNEEVYFNEPNYGHMLGTPEGTRLNRGYCNIARYGTVRFAMVDQLRRTDGIFLDVIRCVCITA